MVTEEKTTAWETETGLPNDFDGWITNPRFGQREEYASKVQETSPEASTSMLLFDLADENGQVVANQGYTIGKDWVVSDDGLSISHPKRKNVVTATMYGALQNRVVGPLKVDMDKHGKPTEAMSWNGLGFHWMLEEHATVGGSLATGLMPVEFLSKKDVGTPSASAAPAKPAVPADLEKQLIDLKAEHTDIKAFQLAAIKIPAVSGNDELMASVLDEGPGGFWSTH